MKSSDIKAALRQRYSGQEWSIMFEVGDSTGGAQRRWADAVAMNLWPSRGLAIHGFEIKVSRSDWLSELKNPAKSMPVQQYCDHWWIVTPPKLVAPDELPPTWGLLEVNEKQRFKTITQAPKLNSIEITRPFVAAMMRRVDEVDQGLVNSIVESRVAEKSASIEELIQRRVQDVTRKASENAEVLEKFQRATGFRLHSYTDFSELSAAIALIRKSGLFGAYSSIKHVRTGLAEQIKEIDEIMSPFDELLADAKKREDEEDSSAKVAHGVASLFNNIGKKA